MRGRDRRLAGRGTHDHRRAASRWQRSDVGRDRPPAPTSRTATALHRRSVQRPRRSARTRGAPLGEVHREGVSGLPGEHRLGAVPIAAARRVKSAARVGVFSACASAISPSARCEGRDGSPSSPSATIATYRRPAGARPVPAGPAMLGGVRVADAAGDDRPEHAEGARVSSAGSWSDAVGGLDACRPCRCARSRPCAMRGRPGVCVPVGVHQCARGGAGACARDRPPRRGRRSARFLSSPSVAAARPRRWAARMPAAAAALVAVSVAACSRSAMRDGGPQRLDGEPGPEEDQHASARTGEERRWPRRSPPRTSRPCRLTGCGRAPRPTRARRSRARRGADMPDTPLPETSTVTSSQQQPAPEAGHADPALLSHARLACTMARARSREGGMTARRRFRRRRRRCRSGAPGGTSVPGNGHVPDHLVGQPRDRCPARCSRSAAKTTALPMTPSASGLQGPAAARPRWPRHGPRRGRCRVSAPPAPRPPVQRGFTSITTASPFRAMKSMPLMPRRPKARVRACAAAGALAMTSSCASSTGAPAFPSRLPHHR